MTIKVLLYASVLYNHSNSINMKNLEIGHLRKKCRHIGIRVSDEEREALEPFCKMEEISITNFFRLALSEMIHAKKT